MVKLILCIIIIFCGAVSGLHLSRRLTKRRDVLSGFEMMFHRALIRIEYNAGDLCEVFSDNFAGYDFTHDKPFEEQWDHLIKSCSPSLTKEDIALLNDFLNHLGTADSESQRQHIVMYSRLIQERIDSAKEDIQTKSKMYRVIPLSASIVISLLMI
ncbi:stage III sporulation protein AB [Ruminococcus sp.]|uniref:stage III sporulation protein AB n=1 Tax=Ruminococcus sp. TaxID=41978 RepID=UPI00386649C3